MSECQHLFIIGDGENGQKNQQEPKWTAFVPFRLLFMFLALHPFRPDLPRIVIRVADSV
jgi:hypothetical protein